MWPLVARLQLGVARLIAHNPGFNGRATGWYFFAGSFAVLLMPIITGQFATQHLAQVMQGLLVVSVINVILVGTHAMRVVDEIEQKSEKNSMRYMTAGESHGPEEMANYRFLQG